MSDSGRSRRHRILTPKGQDYAQEILLKEVKRKSRSLTNHISLFEDLPKTKDVTLTKGELDKLEPMFRELEEAASKFLEVAQGEDKTQVVNIVNTERESVGRVTKAVTEWLEARSKEDAKSGRSETSRRSNMKSTISRDQFTKCNVQSAVSRMKCSDSNMQSGTCIVQSAACIFQHAIWSKLGQ